KSLLFGWYGADGAPLDTIEAIDIAYSTSEVIARMQTPRAELTASVLPDGSILLVGGIGPGGTPPPDARGVSAGGRGPRSLGDGAGRRSRPHRRRSQGRSAELRGRGAQRRRGA